MTTSAASEWEAEIGAWGTRLRAAGRRPGTIGLRRAHLTMLSVWAAPRGPWELGTEDLEAWAGSKNWAPSTRRSVRASLRGFYTWGVTAKRISENPATDLPSVPVQRPRPRPCDRKVLRAAVAAADPREVLMIRFAAECGMRRGEIAQIHTRDLMPDLLRWSLLVHGKGGKLRVIPLPDMLAGELARRAREEPGYLFPGKIDGHLSAAWVGRIVSRWLDGPWTMHTLRHLFATHTHNRTKNLLAVQQQLGHASPATTQLYVEVPMDDMRELVEIAADELLGNGPGPAKTAKCMTRRPPFGASRAQYPGQPAPPSEPNQAGFGPTDRWGEEEERAMSGGFRLDVTGAKRFGSSSKARIVRRPSSRALKREEEQARAAAERRARRAERRESTKP